RALRVAPTQASVASLPTVLLKTLDVFSAIASACLFVSGAPMVASILGLISATVWVTRSLPLFEMLRLSTLSSGFVLRAVISSAYETIARWDDGAGVVGDSGISVW